MAKSVEEFARENAVTILYALVIVIIVLIVLWVESCRKSAALVDKFRSLKEGMARSLKEGVTSGGCQTMDQAYFGPNAGPCDQPPAYATDSSSVEGFGAGHGITDGYSKTLYEGVESSPLTLAQAIHEDRAAEFAKQNCTGSEVDQNDPWAWKAKVDEEWKAEAKKQADQKMVEGMYGGVVYREGSGIGKTLTQAMSGM